ncbi:MAG: metallophosphoesterase, partial [Thermoguttaceae bacterium]|nr:metallophosphoesterase [Thermoguttaceae bacterium]
MWIWIALLVFLIVSMVLSAVYLTVASARFGLFRKIGGENRLYRCAASFGILLAIFAAAVLTIGTLNAVIVFLHLFVAFFLFGVLFRIVAKCRKKEFSFYAQGWFAVLSTIVYLAIGWFLCHHVWRTGYSLSTTKPIESVRIALFADSHIGTTFDGEGFARHLESIMRQTPDLVVIAGDFVDDGTTRRDMLIACEALGKIKPKYGVWFAYGNHDQGYFRDRGFLLADLVEALKKNNVHVLG